MVLSRNLSSSELSAKSVDSTGLLTSREKKKANAESQQRRRSALRGVLILSLISAVAICSSLAWTQLKAAEENVGLKFYQSIAVSATDGAKLITERKFQGSEVMSTLFGEIFPNSSDWPFINFDGYIPIAQKVASLSSSDTQSLMLMVDPSQARNFEMHIKQVYIAQGRPQGAGYSKFGFGIWKRDRNETKTYKDARLQDITGETTWGGKDNKMAVLSMHNSPKASSLMYNIYSTENHGVHLDSIYDCISAHQDATTSPSCPIVTDMMTLVVSDDMAA